MVDINTAIYISLTLMAYYLILQGVDNFMRSGAATNTPNETISKLRTEWGVTIKTFNRNNNLLGFAWFKSIWINESLYRSKSSLLFTFHHEYYHYKHKHKQWLLTLRFTLALFPLLLSVIQWYYVAIIILGLATVIRKISLKFEEKADKYAAKMLDKERTGSGPNK